MVSLWVGAMTFSSRCVFPTVRACPVIAFSTTTRRRSTTPFPITTHSTGGWHHPRMAIPCRRHFIHSSPIILAASSSSSSSSTTTNSTNSITPTPTTTTTTTTSNNNKNKNDDDDMNKTRSTTTSNNNTSFDPIKDEVPSAALLSTTTPQRGSSSLSRRFRKGLGNVFSTMGFVSSSLSSLVRDPSKVWDQTQRPLQAFRNFLQTSGIDKELNQALSTSALSMALLFRVHSSSSSSSSLSHPFQQRQQQSQPQPEEDETLDTNFWQRARRYMRYATAVYGRSMIRAATVDARGNFRDLAESVGQETLQTIANHVQVPVQDLVWVEVDYYDYKKDQDINNNNNNNNNDHHHCLRHLVAVDHAHQELVLAIRGTFSIQEIVVDLTSFSREGFGGGEAHEGMATMAERLWQVAGPVIVQTLQDHPNYSLVVTGHSLGAGTASLLTILLKQQQQQQQKYQWSSSPASVPRIPPTTSVRCFAFASPPVFTPLDLIPHVTPCITNFIHERDVVPFLSVYSVRHLLASLQAIQSVELSLADKLAIIAGSQPPPPELVAAVQNVPSVIPIRGAPRLQIPAAKTIWLHHSTSPFSQPTRTVPSSSPDDGTTTTTTTTTAAAATTTTTTYTVCTTLPFDMRVHPNMIVDHFPARYEYALEHLSVK